MLNYHRSTTLQHKALLTHAVYRRAGIPRHADVPKRWSKLEVPDR